MTTMADLHGSIRNTLLGEGHLIWEDSAEAYATELSDWPGGGYRTV